MYTPKGEEKSDINLTMGKLDDPEGDPALRGGGTGSRRRGISFGTVGVLTVRGVIPPTKNNL